MVKPRTIKKSKYELAYEYETQMSWNCPKRGRVTETVVVKRYASQIVPEKMSI